MYEDSELTVFKNIKYLGEIFSNLPKGLLETNVDKNLNPVDNYCWQ